MNRGQKAAAKHLRDLKDAIAKRTERATKAEQELSEKESALIKREARVEQREMKCLARENAFADILGPIIEQLKKLLPVRTCARCGKLEDDLLVHGTNPNAHEFVPEVFHMVEIPPEQTGKCATCGGETVSVGDGAAICPACEEKAMEEETPGWEQLPDESLAGIPAPVADALMQDMPDTAESVRGNPVASNSDDDVPTEKK